MAKNMHHLMVKVHEAVICYTHLLILPLLDRNVFLQFLASGPSKEKKGLTQPKSVLEARKLYEKLNLKRLKDENSDLEAKEIRKKAGVEWAALDSEGRSPYLTMVEEDKKRYAMEIGAHYHNLGDGNENSEGT
jgi:hypothetical protein